MDPLQVLLILAAGVADGLNPCSFSGLLVFASVTAAALERTVSSCHEMGVGMEAEAADFQRGRLLRYGGTWIVALFAVYTLLGLGFLEGARMLIGGGHWAGKVAAISAVAMGVWMLRDYLRPASSHRMEPPMHLKRLAGRYLRVLTYPGIFVAGILVGLCTIPCSGGIYLSVLAMLSTQDRAAGFLLLTLYNLMFVAPLVLVLAVTTNRRSYRAVARWHVRHQREVKLTLAAAMVALGMFTLFLLT